MITSLRHRIHNLEGGSPPHHFVRWYLRDGEPSPTEDERRQTVALLRAAGHNPRVLTWHGSVSATVAAS